MPGELLEWASDSEPALAKSCRSGHAGLVGQLLFTSLLLRRPVSLGPLSGFARRLQSPVVTGTPTRRRSEGARFSETSLVPSSACNPGCPSSGTPECPHGFRPAISNPAQCKPRPVRALSQCDPWPSKTYSLYAMLKHSSMSRKRW